MCVEKKKEDVEKGDKYSPMIAARAACARTVFGPIELIIRVAVSVNTNGHRPVSYYLFQLTKLIISRVATVGGGASR